MEQQYKIRLKLLLTLLPAILLLLVIGSFLIYSFYDRSTITELPQNKIVKSENEKLKFLVFGDSGSGSDEQKSLVPLMERENPDLILHTGDLAYESGSAREINDNALAVYKNLFSKAAFYPVLGNHDYLTDNGQPFIDTFDLPDNERYYSFSVGKILFIALDSNAPLDEVPNKMLPWLEQTLSEKTKQNNWTLVYFHHPAYSSGSHGSEKRIEDKIVPILEKYRVDIVFNGHDHNYQRTCEILKNRCDKKGILYIVTGGGGKELYPVGAPQWFTEVQKSVYHFVVAEKDGCKLALKAVDLSGLVFDKVTKSKC